MQRRFSAVLAEATGLTLLADLESLEWEAGGWGWIERVIGAGQRIVQHCAGEHGRRHRCASIVPTFQSTNLGRPAAATGGSSSAAWPRDAAGRAILCGSAAAVGAVKRLFC